MSMVVLVALLVGAGTAGAQVRTVDDLDRLFETDPAAAFMEADRMFEGPQARGDLDGMVAVIEVVRRHATPLDYTRSLESMASAAIPVARQAGRWGVLGELCLDLLPARELSAVRTALREPSDRSNWGYRGLALRHQHFLRLAAEAFAREGRVSPRNRDLEAINEGLPALETEAARIRGEMGTTVADAVDAIERAAGRGDDAEAVAGADELEPAVANQQTSANLVRALLLLERAHRALGQLAEANEWLDRALTAAGGDCDILHIATHGFADPDFPEFSGLLLAGRDEEPYEVLTAGEVYAWPLRARLVTLSACQTALGRDVEGEGLLGLTRAFIYAGARDVVCSLWPVSDESTKTLMSAFYAKLQEGAPVEVALQEAQKALMQQSATTHPFHWAGFVPVRGPE